MPASDCGPHCPKFAQSSAPCCQCSMCHGKPVVEKIKKAGKTGKGAKAYKKKYGKKA